MVSESVLPDEKYYSLSFFKKEKDRLSVLLQIVKDDINAIKSRYPYTMKNLLQNTNAIRAKKAELNAKIKELKATLAAYTAKIDEMLG
jgi:peptidoglycan hydrolase CwlO-like protein